jgi:hypothetical protein
MTGAAAQRVERVLSGTSFQYFGDQYLLQISNDVFEFSLTYMNAFAALGPSATSRSMSRPNS